DSQPMLAYLTKPNQPSIRQTNFTQTGNNIHVGTPPPCVISTFTANTCVQLFNAAAICHFEGGKWYGSGSDAPDGMVYTSCCEANLSKDQTKIFNQLTDSMNTTLASEPACPGDGNLDKVVNLADLTNWFYFATNGVPPMGGGPPNTSSWYDFNLDGKTDSADL